MKRIALALALLIPIPALAGDDEQAAAPPTLPPPGVSRPATPSPSASAAVAIDEERLRQIVDLAVARAIARRDALAGAPVAAQAPAPSPQSATPPAIRREIVPTAAPRRITYAPVEGVERQYARVVVPAPWHRRAMARVGERLVECGRPRTKLLEVAPAEVRACLSAPPPQAVYPAPQSE